MVPFVCCLLPCLIVLFLSFFLAHPSYLLLTFVSLRGVDYLPELSRRGFVSLPYLISPILARPFLDTIKTAGAPACSVGEWGGVPSVPELSSSVLIRCFYACILMFSHFSCILHSSFCLGLASPVCSCILPEFARYSVPFMVFHDLFHYISQGDRPLPAPREAGPLGSSLRRRRLRPVGGVAPPRPQPSVFCSVRSYFGFHRCGVTGFCLAFLRFFSVIAYPVLFIAICLSSRDVSCLFAVLRDFFHNISLGIPSGWELALPRPLLFFVFTGFYR